MTPENFFDAMQEIDPDLLEEAEKAPGRRRSYWKWLSAAAVFLLVFAVAAGIARRQPRIPTDTSGDIAPPTATAAPETPSAEIPESQRAAEEPATTASPAAEQTTSAALPSTRAPEAASSAPTAPPSTTRSPETAPPATARPPESTAQPATQESATADAETQKTGFWEQVLDWGASLFPWGIGSLSGDPEHALLEGKNASSPGNGAEQPGGQTPSFDPSVTAQSVQTADPETAIRLRGDTTVSLAADRTSAALDETVTVCVRAAGVKDLTSIILSLRYDETCLACVSADAASVKDLHADVGCAQSGLIRYGAFFPNVGDIPDGDILVLTFRVLTAARTDTLLTMDTDLYGISDPVGDTVRITSAFPACSIPLSLNE